MTECYGAIGYNSTNGTDDVVNNSTTNCTTGTDATPASSTGVFISAIQGVVGVVIIFANCMVIASIWRMRKRNTSFHLWMAHLAVADAGVGVLILVRVVDTTLSIDNEPLCRFSMALWCCTLGASTTGLLAMSIRTYVDIKRASELKLTPAPMYVTILQIIAVWVFWIIFYGMSFSVDADLPISLVECSLLNGMFTKTSILISVLVVFLYMLGIAFFQVQTLQIVKRHLKDMVDKGIVKDDRSEKKKKEREEKDDEGEKEEKKKSNNHGLMTISSMGEMHLPLATFSCQREIVNVERGKTGLTSHPTSLQRNSIPANEKVGSNLKSITSVFMKRQAQILRLSKLTTIIVILFSACWLPAAITVIIFFFCTDRDRVTCTVPENVRSICATLLTLNSLMNAFVYTFKSPEIRSEIKQILFPSWHSVNAPLTRSSGLSTGQDQRARAEVVNS